MEERKVITGNKSYNVTGYRETRAEYLIDTIAKLAFLLDKLSTEATGDGNGENHRYANEETGKYKIKDGFGDNQTSASGIYDNCENMNNGCDIDASSKNDVVRLLDNHKTYESTVNSKLRELSKTMMRYVRELSKAPGHDTLPVVTPQDAAPQDRASNVIQFEANTSYAVPQDAAPQDAAPQDATAQDAAPPNVAPQDRASNVIQFDISKSALISQEKVSNEVQFDISEFEYMAMDAKKLNVREMEKSAALYHEQLGNCGCAGICSLHDSCSCDGGVCDSCEVFKSGMCANRALSARKYPHVREPDGGDYRSVTGDNLVEYRRNDADFDKQMRENTKKRVMTKSSLEAILKEYRILGSRKHLDIEWTDLSLDNVLNMYPHINRRESRIEIQMGIYAWMNYRNDIDVHHMSERFGIPVFDLNNYFKKYYLTTFPVFFHKIRSAASKRLLLVDNLRMGEISDIIGYKSSFHYSVNFKRIEGISPNFYKRLYITQKGKIDEIELRKINELETRLRGE